MGVPTADLPVLSSGSVTGHRPPAVILAVPSQRNGQERR